MMLINMRRPITIQQTINCQIQVQIDHRHHNPVGIRKMDICKSRLTELLRQILGYYDIFDWLIEFNKVWSS